MVKLKYVDNSIVDPLESALAFEFWSANNCFDPYVATGGHQPMNFDQWAALYNHYTVVASKIKVEFSTLGTGVSAGMVCGVYLVPTTSLVSTAPGDLMEQALCKWKLKYNGATQNGSSLPVITHSMNAKKYFNVTNMLDNTSRLGATVAASPLEQAYYCVFIGSLPGDTSNIPVTNLIVTIEYTVIFSEPKDQPGS